MTSPIEKTNAPKKVLDIGIQDSTSATQKESSQQTQHSQDEHGQGQEQAKQEPESSTGAKELRLNSLLCRIWSLLTYTPHRCRWDPANPVKFSWALTFLFGFATTFTVCSCSIVIGLAQIYNISFCFLFFSKCLSRVASVFQGLHLGSNSHPNLNYLIYIPHKPIPQISTRTQPSKVPSNGTHQSLILREKKGRKSLLQHPPPNSPRIRLRRPLRTRHANPNRNASRLRRRPSLPLSVRRSRPAKTIHVTLDEFYGAGLVGLVFDWKLWVLCCA
jgi:hypothetical protein